MWNSKGTTAKPLLLPKTACPADFLPFLGELGILELFDFLVDLSHKIFWNSNTKIRTSIIKASAPTYRQVS